MPKTEPDVGKDFHFVLALKGRGGARYEFSGQINHARAGTLIAETGFFDKKPKAKR